MSILNLLSKQYNKYNFMKVSGYIFFVLYTLLHCYTYVISQQIHRIMTLMFIFIFLIGDFAYAASLFPNQNQSGKNLCTEIIIITHSAQKTENYKINNGIIINRGTIRYVDKTGNVNYVKLTSKKNDTIRIYPQMQVVELLHNYNAFDSFKYILNQGDTLSIVYHMDNIPIAQILNREYNNFELNYDYLWNKKIDRLNTLSSYAIYTHPYELVNKKSKVPFKDQLKEIKEDYKNKLFIDLKKESTFLDSLKITKNISDSFYIYRKNNIYSIFSCFDFKNTTDSLDIFTNKHTFTYKMDTLIKYEYYRRQLNWNLFKLRKSSNSTDSEVFFRIKKSQEYSIGVKKYMLRILLEDIKEKCSHIQFLSLANDYLNTTNDSIYLKEITRESTIPIVNEWDILIKDINGNEKHFDDFLQIHKGKYIYMDFWATWCTPCKQLLRYNERLRKQFPDIIFICLAINDRLSSWKEEVISNKTLFPDANYFIMNSKNSTVIDKLNISLIPRYMLIDKQGKIVNNNAPRPNSVEIYKIFRSLK